MAKKQIDMTSGSPLKLLTSFTIPALISNFLSQLYSLTDSIIVGRFLGETSLAAIGVTLPIILLVVSLIIGVNIGCGVLFSQAFGRKDFDGMRHLLVNSIYFALFLSVFIAIFGFVFSEKILILMNTPSEPLKQASTYLKITFASTIFPLFYYLLYNTFRGMGDSVSSLICLIVSVIFNIGLDLVFVLIFKMGVAGTAWATALAQAIAVIFSFVLLNIKFKELRLKKEDAKLDLKLIRKVCKLALPFALQNGVNNLGNIMVQSCINSFGDSIMASYTAASRVGAFALIPVENVGASLSIYTGQNYGAKKEDRINKGVNASHILNLILSSFVAIMLLAFGKKITYLFLESPSEEIISISYNYLLIAAVPCIICGIMHIYQSVLKGLGRAIDSAIGGICQLIVKVSISFIGAYVFHNTSIIWLSWPISFIAGTIYPLIIYSIYKRKIEKKSC